MKNGGWPNDLRAVTIGGPVLVIKPDGKNLIVPATYFERIPKELKDERRFKREMKIWRQEHKTVWLNKSLY